MKIKRYVKLIISTEPIDLKGLKLEENEAVQHFIDEELEISSEDGDGGHTVVMKALPGQTLKNCGNVYRGTGGSLSVAITAFLHDVCNSDLYDPLRNRRQRQQDDCNKEKLVMDSFANLVFVEPDCVMPEIEFRLPNIGESVIVHHGLLKAGRGTVIDKTHDSLSPNVTIMIDGARRRFPVVYTFDRNSSAWACQDGNNKRDTACYIALYPKSFYSVPIKFTLLFPPTNAAKAYANRVYLNRDKMRVLTGNENL